MAVHQILPAANPADPATGAALGLMSLLRRIGPSEVYAARVDPALGGKVLPLSALPARKEPGPASVFLYHAGIGHPGVLNFLLEAQESVVVIYQDVPPAESFVVLQPEQAQRLGVGDAHLVLLRDRVRLALVDSAGAAQHLRGLGYGDVRICPLPVDLTPLRDAEPHPPTWHHLQTQIKGPLVLADSQFLPHGRMELVVGAYHALVTFLLPDAHLAMVGPAPVPAYRDAVEHLAIRLALAQSWIVPNPAMAELAGLYRAARVFLAVSDHPGFSVPCVHALGFDVPVVARAAGGVPETLGRAGLMLPADTGPLLLAEALAAAIEDGGLREGLTAAGRHRLAELDPHRAEATLLGSLVEVL